MIPKSVLYLLRHDHFQVHAPPLFFFFFFFFLLFEHSSPNSIPIQSPKQTPTESLGHHQDYSCFFLMPFFSSFVSISLAVFWCFGFFVLGGRADATAVLVVVVVVVFVRVGDDFRGLTLATSPSSTYPSMSPPFDKTISLFPSLLFFFFFFFSIASFNSLIHVAARFFCFFPSALTSPATVSSGEDNNSGDLGAALSFTCVTAASGLDLNLDWDFGLAPFSLSRPPVLLFWALSTASTRLAATGSFIVGDDFEDVVVVVVVRVPWCRRGMVEGVVSRVEETFDATCIFSFFQIACRSRIFRIFRWRACCRLI